MESLNDIGVSEDTDKAALTHRGCHHYVDLYELLFRRWRGCPIDILEVGVLDGGSIRMWRRYFPAARIVAVDVNDRVNFADDPSIEFIHGDSYSDEVISKLSGRKFDIIIDDGDHQLASQRIFLQRYPGLLSKEGILIIEDVILKEDALTLKKGIPEGFHGAIVQMNEGSSIFDSRLLIVYRK